MGSKRPLEGKHGTMGDEIEDQIVAFSASGEVLPGVIDRVVRAVRAVYGYRMNLDPYLVVFGDGCFHLGKTQYVRRPMGVSPGARHGLSPA